MSIGERRAKRNFEFDLCQFVMMNDMNRKVGVRSKVDPPPCGLCTSD